MKKHLLVKAVFILAIVTFVLTSMKKTKPRVTYCFKYIGLNYAQANVQNPANWINVDSISFCNGINQKACGIVVPSTVTTEVDGEIILLPTTVINSLQYLPCISYYVIPTGDVIQARNKNCQ